LQFLHPLRQGKLVSNGTAPGGSQPAIELGLFPVSRDWMERLAFAPRMARGFYVGARLVGAQFRIARRAFYFPRA